MILVVILEPFLFSLKYTWMVICILEEAFLIIWNVCLTQEQKFEKGWLNDTSYDVFTWYNQLFSVWKWSPVSRWSIRSQKPKPLLPTNDEHPWKSKANSKLFVALQVYKKWESLRTPDILTTTKAGMKATTTTIQRPVSVSERSLEFKRYRFSNLSHFR